MWRSIFLAIGISLTILGAECLFLERAVLADSTPSGRSMTAFERIVRPEEERPNELRTKDWMPWSFMSAGAIIILYTVTIPRRMTG